MRQEIDIVNTLKLLREHDFEGFSYNIEIAKGLNKRPTTIKEGINQIKRAFKWQLRKR